MKTRQKQKFFFLSYFSVFQKKPKACFQSSQKSACYLKSIRLKSSLIVCVTLLA